ncbi:hypothetical protein TEA_016321 [Camellia sinensis var. sinensis]|uniref:Uncharacterized protein n=1 Tax=Camellia sinensis var. sinensis TaxID=542762 RepID=A0A4S4EWK8_CAMSN|nr:hypothetical protein TEA_016321 [Camellia sinensis var. sinensis]
MARNLIVVVVVCHLRLLYSSSLMVARVILKGLVHLGFWAYLGYTLVSIFLLLGIVVAGAALGCWLVWKFVISDDGSVDVGVAQFVKWATRVIAATFIFQVAIVFMLINSVIMLHLHISGPNGNQTLDTPLVMGALASCLSICFLITSFKWNGPDSTITFGNSIYSANGNPWWTIGRANVRQNRAEFLSRAGMVASRGTLEQPKEIFWLVRLSCQRCGVHARLGKVNVQFLLKYLVFLTFIGLCCLMWCQFQSSYDLLFMLHGMISLTTGRVTRNQQDYYSTFHRTPNRKKFSKKEWENITQESTRHAVAELASSPKFTDWIIKHADRI